MMSARSVGVCAEVEQLREAQLDIGLLPDEQGAGGALLEEHHLPVLEPQRREVAVVRHVEEVATRALFDGTRDVVQLVVPVEVHSEIRAVQLGAFLQALGDVPHLRPRPAA